MIKRKVNYLIIGVLLFHFISPACAKEHGLEFYLNQAQHAEMEMNAPLAAEAYGRAVAVCREEKRDSLLPKLLVEYGIMLTYSGNHEAAIKALMEAFQRAEKSDLFLESKARSCMSLGIVYFFMEDWDNALKYYYRAEAFAQELENLQGISIAKNNIANIYQKKGNFSKAISLYEETLALQVELADTPTICNTHFNLATCFAELHQVELATTHFEKALLLSQLVHDAEIEALTLSNLANLYNDQGREAEAVEMIERAISLSRTTGYSVVTLNALIKASLIYQSTSDFKAALFAEREARELKDSIFKADAAEQLHEFQTRYETQEKQLQIEAQELVIRQQRINQLMLSMVILLFIGFLILLIYIVRMQRRSNRELAKMNAVKNKFFSIISHDLKNPVFAQEKTLQLLVENYALLSDHEKLEQCTLLSQSSKSLLDLLVNLLDWSRLESGKMSCHPVDFPLTDAVREVENLLLVVAKEKEIELQNKIPMEAVVTADHNMVTTVLRNLISNAIKFSHIGGTITISALRVGTHWKVSITDQGVGMSQEVQQHLFQLGYQNSTPGTHGESGSGLGLIVTSEMVTANHGQISVESLQERGTTITFTLKAATL